MSEKDELILQLENSVEHLNALIKEELDYARVRGISPHRMRSTDGSLALSPLLSAKAQALSALAPLKFNRT